MYISAKNLKASLDSINGGIVSVAKCADNLTTVESREAYSAAKVNLEERVQAMLVECGVSITYTSFVVDICFMRAVSLRKGAYTAVSGTTFRKWFKHEVLENTCAVEFDSRKPAENETVRKMTPEEKAKWIENRKAKLLEQLAKLEAIA